LVAINDVIGEMVLLPRGEANDDSEKPHRRVKSIDASTRFQASDRLRRQQHSQPSVSSARALNRKQAEAARITLTFSLPAIFFEPTEAGN
jgi:hypothetical protein